MVHGKVGGKGLCRSLTAADSSSVSPCLVVWSQRVSWHVTFNGTSVAMSSDDPPWKKLRLSLERPYKDDNGNAIPVLFDITPEGKHIYQESVARQFSLRIG